MIRRSGDSGTNVSLILKVVRSPADQAAWSEFVDRYGPKVLAWCRGWGLQQADAEDVTQVVLVKLVVQMNRFSYDPSRSFRGWLRRLASNAWHDWLAQRVTPGEGGSEVNTLLGSIAAREDLVRRLEAEFDLEVLGEAMHRVRERVDPKTWEAFRLIAEDGLPATAVAARLGTNVAGAYKSKSNVLKMIKEEVQLLEAGPSDDFND
jgi:RNA polymerase sigma-70 factor (ECF subfamily)